MAETRDKFVVLLGKLLRQVTVVFKECLKTKEYLLMYETFKDNKDTQELMITQWYEIMSPYFVRCKQEDPTVLDENIDMFRKLDLKSKFNDPGFTQQKTLWAYIKKLNELSSRYQGKEIPDAPTSLAQADPTTNKNFQDLFAAVPPGIRQNIESMMSSMTQTMTNADGTFNPKALDFSTVWQMTQTIIEKSNPDDLKQFEQAVPTLFSSLPMTQKRR